jgi:hypothetical protein
LLTAVIASVVGPIIVIHYQNLFSPPVPNGGGEVNNMPKDAPASQGNELPPADTPEKESDGQSQLQALPQSAEQNACNRAYPDVCITTLDLDCDDVGIRNFRVLPPDPYGFDPDKDGIGCES